MIKKIIYIEWIDAAASSGWLDNSDAAKEASVEVCHSVGYLIYEDKTQIILASTVSDKQSNARIAVPKKWIRARSSVKL